jgi:hypothetical protein
LSRGLGVALDGGCLQGLTKWDGDGTGMKDEGTRLEVEGWRLRDGG